MAKFYKRSKRYNKKTFKKVSRPRNNVLKGYTDSTSRPPLVYQTEYDGLYYAKVNSRSYLSTDAVPSNASIAINWGINGVSTGNALFISDSPEFVSLVPNFQQWKVIGVEVQFVPMREITGAISTGIYDLSIGSDTTSTINAIAVTDIQVQKFADYKPYAPTKKVTRYYDAGHMYKAKGWEWQTGGVAPSYYPPASTLLRLHSLGYGVASTLAVVHATWYVAFKGWST